MPEKRRKKLQATSVHLPTAEVAEVFEEFRRSESRIAEIPRLYSIDEAGRAHTIYFQLSRPQVRADLQVRATIRDIGAAGFSSGLSVQLQVGEQVLLRALDVVSDALLFEQEYVVRSVRKSTSGDKDVQYVAGLQLLSGCGPLLFKAYLESVYIQHLFEEEYASTQELLKTLFPGYRPGAGPAKQSSDGKDNVQLSLNVGSIRRPTARSSPAVAAEHGAAGQDAAEPEDESGLIFKAGKPGQTCKAAIALDGLLYKDFEVPSLPLAPCTHKLQCTCGLQTFAERRDAHRRDANDRRTGEEAIADSGRRLGIDRRQAG